MARPQSAVRENPTHTLSAEHHRLEIFIGNWLTNGETIAATDAPAMPIFSNDVYEWLPGGHFVVHRWNGHVGDVEVHGLEVIGADAESGMFCTHFFDNDGNSGSETLTVEGRTWTWLGRQAMGASWHRCTSIVSDDGTTMTARHEQSSDGRSWTPWMDVTLRRDETG